MRPPTNASKATAPPTIHHVSEMPVVAATEATAATGEPAVAGAPAEGMMVVGVALPKMLPALNTFPPPAVPVAEVLTDEESPGISATVQFLRLRWPRNTKPSTASTRQPIRTGAYLVRFAIRAEVVAVAAGVAAAAGAAETP